MRRSSPQAGGKLAPETNDVEALYEFLKLENSKFYAYVQHPKKQEAAVTASAVAGGKATGTGGVDVGEEAAMKVYLTKKERKRIRRTTRMERERWVGGRLSAWTHAYERALLDW